MSESTKTISKSMKKRVKIQSKGSDHKTTYKTVLMPIRVPAGKCCWNHRPPHEICEYFGNEGGHPQQCRLGFYPLEEEDNGVLKPKECLNFKDEV